MAQFRNVSGVDRRLALPDWYEPRTVEADGTVEVDDALVYAGPPAPQVVDGVEQPVPPDHHIGTYDFNQPGIWERVEAAPTPSRKAAAPADDTNGGN